MQSVSVYLRVSTQDQRHDLQKVEIDEFLARSKYTNIEYYADKASGTKHQRPELQRLMTDARQKKFKILVIYKLDRLFRSLRHLVSTINEFEELGIKLISIKDSIDLTTASGRLLVHIVAAFAEFEAAIIRERVISGLKAAKSKGRILGRPRTIDRILILRLFSTGMTVTAIAKQIGVSKATVSRTLNPQHEVQNRRDVAETSVYETDQSLVVVNHN